MPYPQVTRPVRPMFGSAAYSPYEVSPTCGEPNAEVRSVSLSIAVHVFGSCDAASTGPVIGLYVAAAEGEAAALDFTAAVCWVAPSEQPLNTPSASNAPGTAASLMAHTVVVAALQRSPPASRRNSRPGARPCPIMERWAMTLMAM